MKAGFKNSKFLSASLLLAVLLAVITIVFVNLTDSVKQNSCPSGQIYTLDYFLQTYPEADNSGFGEIDVISIADPENNSIGTTYSHTFFGNSELYEIFKIDDDGIKLRFEVNKGIDASNPNGSNAFIRRYDPNPSSKQGYLWMPKYVPVGTYLESPNQYYDEYRWNPNLSGTNKYWLKQSVPGYSKVIYYHVYDNDPMANFIFDTGSPYEGSEVLIRRDFWHPSGQIFEDYLYVKSLGRLGWRVMEGLEESRISTNGTKYYFNPRWKKIVIEIRNWKERNQRGWVPEAYLNNNIRYVEKIAENPRSSSANNFWFVECATSMYRTNKLKNYPREANLNFIPATPIPVASIPPNNHPLISEIPFEYPTELSAEGVLLETQDSNKLKWKKAIKVSTTAGIPEYVEAYQLEYRGPQNESGSYGAFTVVQVTGDSFTLPAGMKPGLYQWKLKANQGERTNVYSWSHFRRTVPEDPK